MLGVARQNQAQRNVTFIHSRISVPWYQLLWMHHYMVLVSLAVLSILLFWSAVRRFGPMLPDLVPARRALMEHIDASGIWLARAPGGRALLLAAAREDLQATLLRRAPALQRMTAPQQCEELARQSSLDPALIDSALYGEPSSIDSEFTRQIRTVQTLRKHYER
jgi:hypothetical protein